MITLEGGDGESAGAGRNCGQRSRGDLQGSNAFRTLCFAPHLAPQIKQRQRESRLVKTVEYQLSGGSDCREELDSRTTS